LPPVSALGEAKARQWGEQAKSQNQPNSWLEDSTCDILLSWFRGSEGQLRYHVRVFDLKRLSNTAEIQNVHGIETKSASPNEKQIIHQKRIKLRISYNSPT